jgi:hypothetical protein
MTEFDPVPRRAGSNLITGLVVATLSGAAMSGCSSSLSGEYGGENCLYEMNFRPDGAVYIKFMGMEVAGQYKIDGDKVAVGAPGKEMLVFTKKGNTLEAGFMGEKMECKKK